MPQLALLRTIHGLVLLVLFLEMTKGGHAWLHDHLFIISDL